jgi:hypothetical protein
MITNEAGAQFGVIGIDEGYVQTGEFTGTLATLVQNIATGDAWLMPAIANTDTSTIFLAALASQIGATAAAPRFSYLTQTFNLADQGDDPPSAVANFNAYTSAVIGQGTGALVDRNGTARLAIGADRAEWAQTPAKGLMIVFAENSPGAAQAGLFPFTGFGP